MSSNKIYIVAGERNIKLAQLESGLWANVGQTSREVSDRLRDDDYKRKAAGGRWQILFAQDVGENLTDKQIHPFLKQHPDVEWDRNSDNTEEFLFKGDPGDGSVARRIVGEILRRVCLPILQDENVKLQDEVSRLQLELQDSNETVASLLSEDAIRESLARIIELEDTNKQMLEDVKQTDMLVKDAERKYKELQDREDRRMAARHTFGSPSLVSVITPERSIGVPSKAMQGLLLIPTLFFAGMIGGGLLGRSCESSSWHKSLDPVVELNNEWSADQLANMLKKQTAMTEASRNNTLSVVSENKELRLKVEQLIKFNQLNSAQSKHTQTSKSNKRTAPVPLSDAEQIRYDDLYDLFGKDDANKFAFSVTKDNPPATEAAPDIDCVSLGEETDHAWAGKARGPWYTNCRTQSEILRLYGDAFTGPKAGAKVKIHKHGNDYIASFKTNGLQARVVIVTDGSGNLK